MSEASVSTTSSRIKQFGLYRTIDARTEEFLRLSRKRQLRQGCACAAVSTAITVTIVVTVILIYEYGIIAEFSSKSTLKPNWLGLMNTSETMPFEAKFNKASINLESSIPLLPLVLKALKKNRYYDNIMEEASSPNPLYEKKETDDLLTKNFFSDTRNWMRIPTSRIYAIEYKTSPIIYYKSPTRNTDYFTKIRRIRDYQRIMNYVDKMISERITGSTMPMLKSSYAFDKNLPIPYTTPISMNYKINHNLQRNLKEKIMKKKPKCRCPKKMHNLLNKMITVLQKLLPNATEDVLKIPIPCHENHKQLNRNLNQVTENSPTTIGEYVNSGIILKTFENSSKLSETNNTLKVTVPDVTKRKIKQDAFLRKPLPPKIDFTLQTIIKLIRPKTFRGNTMVNDLKLYKSKTIKQPSESTEDYYFSPQENAKTLTVLEKSSSSMSPEPMKANVTNIFSSKKFMNMNDLVETSNLKSTFPTFYEEADDDYLVVTPTPNLNSLDALDVHSLELVKSKMIPNRIKLNTKGERLGSNKKTKLLYSDNSKIFKNNSIIWNLLRKMEKLIKSKLIKSESNTEEPINNVTNHDVMMNIKKTDYLHSVDSIPPNTQTIQNFTATPLYTTTKINVNKNEQDLTFKFDDEILENEDITEEDKTAYEQALTLNNLKKIEKIIHLFNNSEAKHNVTNIKAPLHQWESIKIGENSSIEETTKHKSRSSYLEIHRNDWKHDEHQDYDNINNY